jgi:hypothetical protein
MIGIENGLESTIFPAKDEIYIGTTALSEIPNPSIGGSCPISSSQTTSNSELQEIQLL